jgi:hypothetical protein
MSGLVTSEKVRLQTMTSGRKVEACASEAVVCSVCRHLLIVFGGLAGLEESTELDSNIEVGRPCNFHSELSLSHLDVQHTCLQKIHGS